MRYRRLTILFFCVFTVSDLSAQQFINGFKRLGSTEAVPNSSNNKIFESSDHFLWLSSESGLYRFDGYRFTPFFSNSKDSTTLSSNVISSIAEDRLGNLWVGTFGKGVNKLNKKTGKWKQYLHPTKDDNPFYWVFNIFKDRSGQLWLGTNGRGILLYDENSDSFRQFIPDSTKNKTGTARFENEVRDISEDPTDPAFLWLAGTDGLYRFNTKSKKFISYKSIKNNKAEPINNSFHTIYVQDSKNIWLGAWGGGLICFNTITAVFTNYPPSPQEYLKQNFAKNIITDITYCSDSSLYVSTASDGLLEFNLSKQTFKQLNKAQSAGGKNISEEFQGVTHTSDGSTWICSPGYIFQKNPVYERLGAFQPFYQPKEKFVYGATLSDVLYRKDDRQYWMSCNSGYGVYVYDSSFNYLRSVAIENFATDKRLRDIVLDASGTTWLLSKDFPYLYYYDKVKDQFLNAAPQFKDPAFISSGLIEMATDSKGNVWFVNNKQFLKWDPAKKQLQIFSINDAKNNTANGGWQQVELIFDANDNPWMASNIGLYHFNQNNREWLHLASQLNNNQSLANTFVESIAFDKKGNLWIAPMDEGLQLYDPLAKKFIAHYTQSEGFFSARIHDVTTDSRGILWVAGNNGLARYDVQQDQWFTFSREDGLLEDNLFTPLSALDNGIMILGMQNGFTHWNINSLPLNKQKPIVYFNKFVSDGQELTIENNRINLPSSANELSIDFSAIEMIMGNRTKFYYKILPQQKEWIATTQRSISLATITSGEFTLLIKALNADGIESEVKQVTINVAFPFWKTTWFRILCLAFITGIIYSIAKWRIKTLRNEAKNKMLITKQMAEMEMKALRSQMNPHFIFNCINSIDALIQSNDKYYATVYLNKFAKLLRNILDTSKENTVLFNKDVETLTLYIELEEFRHENKFKTNFKIDNELPSSDYKVPPLIVQPFVENAILHGLRNKEENDGLLTITIKKLNDAIQYTITDNGIGRKAAGKIMQNKESHYGMEMSNDRIKLFNKEENASVQITDLYNNNIPAGTEVKVDLNII